MAQDYQSSAVGKNSKLDRPKRNFLQAYGEALCRPHFEAILYMLFYVLCAN